MRKPTFAAVVGTAPITWIIDRIQQRHTPTSVAHMPVGGGWMTLFRWDGLVAAGNPLVTIDGTGGGNRIAIPGDMIEAGAAPAGLRAAALQHHSYLWLEQDGPLVCWTDHLALAGLYHSAIDGGHVIADDPALLADLAPGIDHAMVASFLTNGIMLGGRTLFSGVRALPPASITTFSPGTNAETTRYWEHLPGSAPWDDPAAMERELWSRITGATAARVEGRQAVISLSGGFDSSALLGILHHSGHAFSTFSFAAGTPKAGSDANVARRQAELLGVEHRTYPLPEPFDVVDLFTNQLDGGALMRKPCFELTALQTAASDARRRWRDPIMLFGDEAFGQGALRLVTNDDLLAATTLKDPDLIGKLAGALPSGAADRLSGELRMLYDDMINAIPSGGDKADRMDHMFLDMFLIANMVQIRGRLVAPRIPIALPFLDIGVLHMARHVPAHLRVDKAMFEAAAARNHPELFTLRRAMSRQSQPDATDLVRANAKRIETAIQSLGGSGLTSPTVLQSALRLVNRRDDGRGALLSLVLATGKQLRRRKLLPRLVTNTVQQKIWSKFRSGVGPATLFIRLFYLAMLLDQLDRDENRLTPSPVPMTPDPITISA